MGKFDGILICSDCDGTLTGTDRKISKENIEAIRYFQSEGGYFTVATGRYPEFFRGFAEYVKPNAPIICCNGIGLYDLDKAELISRLHLNYDANKILEFAKSELKDLRTIHMGSIHNTLKEETVDGFFISEDEIARVTIVQSEEDLLANAKKLEDKFSDDLTILIAWNEGVECLPKNCHKAAMLPALKEYLGDVKYVISVGDYDNDVAIFKASDKSYAMGNAPDRVKAQATDIAPDNDHSAIAYIIAELEKSL